MGSSAIDSVSSGRGLRGPQPPLEDVERLLDFRNIVANTTKRYIRLLAAFYVQLVVPEAKAHAYLEPLRSAPISMIVLTSDEQYKMTTLGECVHHLQSGMMEQLVPSLPPSDNSIKRTPACVDSTAKHYQHETTCKPSSMEPIDEPQTLLLANGKIQHSHTIGDSKAPLAVKDSGHHHVPGYEQKSMDNNSEFGSGDLDLTEIDAFLSELDRKYEHAGEELPWESTSISIPRSVSLHNESLVEVANDRGRSGVSPPLSVGPIPIPKQFSQSINDSWHATMEEEQISYLSDGRIKSNKSNSRYPNGIGGWDSNSNPNPNRDTRLESLPHQNYKNSRSPSHSPSVYRGPGAQMKDELKSKRLQVGLRHKLNSELKGKDEGVERLARMGKKNRRMASQDITTKSQRKKRRKLMKQHSKHNVISDVRGPDCNQGPSTPERLGWRLPPFSDTDYWDIERSNLGIRPVYKDASVSIPATDPVTGKGFDPPDTPLEETLYWARVQENPKERRRLLSLWNDRQKQKGTHILDDTLDIDEVEMEDVSRSEEQQLVVDDKIDCGGRGGGNDAEAKALGVRVSTTTSPLENNNVLKNTWEQEKMKKYVVDNTVRIVVREEEDMILDYDEIVEVDDDDEVEVVVCEVKQPTSSRRKTLLL